MRHSRASWHGLTTGVTGRAEILSLLGEPEDSAIYDEDDAFDMMLEPGESFFYTCSGAPLPMVLQAHMDTAGILRCIILRSAMPESLY